ncbi:n-acetylmuramoyl-l-alanine amidase [Lucifera butyrica]|uniref:N-acetylmuramoyl-l-alanine amidase n=1 Tax=Lucifera butyrica TaxID=1351585 RepID=A0A498RF07_9FIRM|nr:N-acetylmuramoyl-L-alanine amidase [Lucifera butyrica]VBB08682.1 n-acetylmuramoyl-l-alanine amidase [Lucifera butyrica]
MQIIIDGQKIPVNPRVTKDILTTLKSMAEKLRWGIAYDTRRGIVYINTRNPSLFLFTPDRLSADNAESAESDRLGGKTICIDPGHGGGDSGSAGPAGTLEKENTLAIAQQLCYKLQKNGASAVMTRESDQEVSYAGAPVAEELASRIDIANKINADLFISIHNDAFNDSTVSGTTTFHYGGTESIYLAKAIQKNLVGQLGTTDRGVRFASFFVIRHARMPAVLTEVAFISNPEEEVLLSSTDGREKAADAIFEGIVSYFKV